MDDLRGMLTHGFRKNLNLKTNVINFQPNVSENNVTYKHWTRFVFW